MKMLKIKTLLVVGLLSVVLCTSAYAEKGIFLYVFFHDDNSQGERFRTKMPDMKTCMEVLKNSKMPLPTSPGGDYEVIGVMWCGEGEFQRNYNGTWWNDKVSKPKRK